MVVDFSKLLEKVCVWMVPLLPQFGLGFPFRERLSCRLPARAPSSFGSLVELQVAFVRRFVDSSECR